MVSPGQGGAVNAGKLGHRGRSEWLKRRGHRMPVGHTEHLRHQLVSSQAKISVRNVGMCRPHGRIVEITGGVLQQLHAGGGTLRQRRLPA